MLAWFKAAYSQSNLDLLVLSCVWTLSELWGLENKKFIEKTLQD